MIGYKIAVGAYKGEGFFPVMVVLDIPDDADVIEPFEGVRVYSHDMMLCCEYPKYRTDKCTVTDVYPLDDKERPDWEPVGYSMWDMIGYCRNYELSVLYDKLKISDITCYSRNKSLYVVGIDTSPELSCGRGIHFFRKKEEAREYYYNDITKWFYEEIYSLNTVIRSISKFNGPEILKCPAILLYSVFTSQCVFNAR